jgi:hypothetical protein
LGVVAFDFTPTALNIPFQGIQQIKLRLDPIGFRLDPFVTNAKFGADNCGVGKIVGERGWLQIE